MSYEEGLKHEQSGDYFSALSIYRRELDSDRLTRDVLRGLFRSTLKVGDIHALSLDLIDLCKSTGISSASAQLMQGRLLVEIGENERARDIANELDSKFFGVSEILELELLRANILALEFRFDEAIKLLKESVQVTTNHLRRIAELELAAQRPENAVIALKFYVQELNKRNSLQGSRKRFITASGFIFNLANQMWLEQKFPQTNGLPSLSESMRILQGVIKASANERRAIFFPLPISSSTLASSYFQKDSLVRQEYLGVSREVEMGESARKGHGKLETLIKFIDEPSQTGEFFRYPLQNWELTFTYVTETDFFCVEESGFALWENFKFRASGNLLSRWRSDLESSGLAGRKDFLSHNYPGASLTRLIAEEVRHQSGRKPLIIPRARLRLGRCLSSRYTF